MPQFKLKRKKLRCFWLTENFKVAQIFFQTALFKKMGRQHSHIKTLTFLCHNPVARFSFFWPFILLRLFGLFRDNLSYLRHIVLRSVGFTKLTLCSFMKSLQGRS